MSLAGCAPPPDACKSLYTSGLTELMVHNYARAEPLLQQAVACAEKAVAKKAHNSVMSPSPIPDPQRLQLADSLTALGQVYSAQGRFASAKNPLISAEQAYELAFGSRDSVQVATAFNELAVCYFKQAEYPEAQAASEKALSIREKLLGEDSLLVASTLNNLAEVCLKQQLDAEAEQYFQRALAIYKKSSKPEAARGLAHTLNNLALYYSKNDRPDDAQKAVTEALRLEESRSLDHADMAATLLARANIERAGFNNDRAQKDFEHAIALLSSDQIPKHEQLCEALDSYADMLLNERRHEEAEPIYKEALRHCRRAHGENHPSVAERLNNLAELYEKDDRFNEAEILLKQALSIDRRCFDSDSPIVLDTMNDLSHVYVHEKKFKKAELVYSEWLPALEKVLGPNHPHVIDALENWAMIARLTHNQPEVDRLLADAKSRRSAWQKPEDRSLDAVKEEH